MQRQLLTEHQTKPQTKNSFHLKKIRHTNFEFTIKPTKKQTFSCEYTIPNSFEQNY